MRVLILVEGQSEERFVKDVLSPHLHRLDVFPIAKLIVTKRVKGGPHYKGGLLSYAQFARDMRLLLGDTSAAKVTSMIDLYHLPPDFPGFDLAMSKPNYVEKVRILREALKREFTDIRFDPYFSIHEYEALTLIDDRPFAAVVPGPISLADLRQLCSAQNPEAINLNDPPAKRILRCAQNYSKYLHGSPIIQQHGIAAVRERCPIFDAWLTSLESLKQ